jgi:hypothetical protein
MADPISILSVSFDLLQRIVNDRRACLAHDFVLRIRASGTTNCADNLSLADEWNTIARKTPATSFAGRSEADRG